ncbi:phospholipase D-like domain-containing protein (plasmid) [Bradyrhizobium sp. CCGUVB23]|nr:phospholipase D-like domain-containing protein [Bradyrhizobium sp. CCGUVB23]
MRIAAPFWGADAIKRLGLERSGKIGGKPAFRLLCNLESGACNPAPISTLRSALKWGAKSNPRLHAKVYIFDEVAIVGSANPSADGLALEGMEAASWHEVCARTKDRKEIAALAAWFDKLYGDPESVGVNKKMLAAAEELWRRRRRDSAEIKTMAARSLKAMASASDGKIVKENTHIWIYSQDKVSDESTAHNSQLRTTHGSISDVPYEVESDPRKYGFDRIIDCFYRKSGSKLECDPAQYRIYPSLTKFIDSGSSKGLWTLPNSRIGIASPGGKLLDQASKQWLRTMVRRKLLDAMEDWGGTLGELIEQTS